MEVFKSTKHCLRARPVILIHLPLFLFQAFATIYSYSLKGSVSDRSVEAKSNNIPFSSSNGQWLCYFRHFSGIHRGLYCRHWRRCRASRLLHQSQRRSQCHRICCPGNQCSWYQNGFFGFFIFCNLWSLSYTLSFIWYILRMSHNLFLPYTLSFISYILRIYSYRILYLLYRIFKNFFLSWFSFRKKHWSWKLTILHFPPAMAIGYITFIKT